MLILILLLTTGYLAWLVWEKRANDRALKSFRYVIHVNGIRGKTGVCRLIDAHLRGAGYRVFTKTTGSTPCYIGTDGVEHQIHRLGNANIGEQLRMIRKAHRQSAEILILECMAVQPELQNFAQNHMVQGNLNVITNVRYDHIFEMGESLEEIAQSLSNTIPRTVFSLLLTKPSSPTSGKLPLKRIRKSFCAAKANMQKMKTKPSPVPWVKRSESRQIPSPATFLITRKISEPTRCMKRKQVSF